MTDLSLFLSFSLAISHSLIVLFLTVILSSPFLADNRKRTGSLILWSSILSIVIGSLFNILIPGCISLNLFLFPIVTILILCLLFLFFDDEPSQQISDTDNPDSFIFSDHTFDNSNAGQNNSSNKNPKKKTSSYNLVKNIIHTNGLLPLGNENDNENTFIRSDGLICQLEFSDHDSQINIWYYFYMNPFSDSFSEQNISVTKLLESFQQSDIEIIPQWYNPQLIRYKYQDQLFRQNIGELFKPLPVPENDIKEHWLPLLQERAALITLIKNPALKLPSHWLILKSHHQLIIPMNLSDHAQSFPLFLQDALTRFSSAIASFPQLNSKDYIRLTAYTPYSKIALRFLHNYELPPLYHLVSLDEHYLDNIFRKEYDKNNEYKSINEPELFVPTHRSNDFQEENVNK